jgi:starvation-inducible DNA-binding protein
VRSIAWPRCAPNAPSRRDKGPPRAAADKAPNPRAPPDLGLFSAWNALAGGRAKVQEGGAVQNEPRENVMAKDMKAAAVRKREAPMATPTDLGAGATKDIAAAMNSILADVYALYIKTKNFHWHISGPHFRDYHLMLDEQGDQIFAMADPIAERIRKVGGSTLRSIGHIARMQHVLDNDADYVEPVDMLSELREDNKALAARLREAHNVCDEHRDIATASLIEVWIDETERRTWFLFEASRRSDSSGH